MARTENQIVSPAEQPSCDLYRHWSQQGDLLYVGISKNAIGRLSQHESKSHWSNEIAKVTIEKHDSRDLALAAELRAIRLEKPLHNIAHARKRKIPIPKAFDRTVDHGDDVDLASAIKDAEGDPFLITFCMDGTYTIWGMEKSHLIFSNEVVQELTELADAAEVWYSKAYPKSAGYSQ